MMEALAEHGLPATSDYDAVRLLRRAGIDPFHRANMLELVVAGLERDSVVAVVRPSRGLLPEAAERGVAAASAGIATTRSA